MADDPKNPDHAQAPVLEAIDAYHRSGYLPFTPPGHKQGRGVDPRVADVLGRDVFRSDVLLTNGLDDRTMGGQILTRAEELMAHAVDADLAFFSTCGSSLSVKSAMLAVAGPGEKLLVARDAHKSVTAGLILSGVQPVWIRPRWDTEYHLAHPPGADTVAGLLDEHPDAKGVLVVSPTAYGSCADIRALAEVCHQRGKPLIIDEAWGAHFPFHPDLPTWAMDAGADLCVTSVHKMGNGLEQGSVFHLQGDRVDVSHLAACADLLGTTSPSVLIYAGLDGWRRQMVEHGRELLDRAMDLARRLREGIAEIGGGLRTMEREDLTSERRSHDCDPLMVVVDLLDLGISGYQAADWLRQQRHINVGLADHRRIILQITTADDDETVGTALDSLRLLLDHAPHFPGPHQVALPSPEGLELETVMLPRDAFFGPSEQVPLENVVGRIGAELVTPYPPGAPAIAPGERISAEVVEYLRTGKQAGMYIPDTADAEVKTLKVVAES